MRKGHGGVFKDPISTFLRVCRVSTMAAGCARSTRSRSRTYRSTVSHDGQRANSSEQTCHDVERVTVVCRGERTTPSPSPPSCLRSFAPALGVRCWLLVTGNTPAGLERERLAALVAQGHARGLLWREFDTYFCDCVMPQGSAAALDWRVPHEGYPAMVSAGMYGCTIEQGGIAPVAALRFVCYT